MKKAIKILLVITILSNFCILNMDNVNATSYTAIVTDVEGMNIRSGPGTNYSIVSALSYNTTVTLVNDTKTSGTGCNEGWYQINYGDSTDRYVCASGLSVSSNSLTYGYYTTNTWGTRISEDYANVRSTPNGALIDVIYMGTKVTVLSESGNFYNISYYNGKTGWVAKKLVKTYSDLTASDTTYYETLKEAGFPESYWPFLTKLHQLHPTWKFKADKTNKDFSTAVNAETGKKLISSTNDALRLSGVSYDSGGWYIANPSVVAIYMDPRNYLNETNIFAFEILSYDASSQTSEVLSAVFKGSYLDTSEYIGYFIKGGKTYGVSPVHLAARVKQEGGTNSGYDAISGVSKLTYNGNPLSGFYNYYNIGAYASGNLDAITRGLAVAAGYLDGEEGTPWNTREKAIVYGAKFIANGYVNAGQDNIYYEEFNVSSRALAPSYFHQYMTNVSAAASESLSTYNSFVASNLIDTGFTFYIPVYDNIPNDFTTLPPIGDTNNDLSDLKVNNTTVTGFDSDVKEYTAYVPFDATSVNITATLKSSNASVVGLGTITLTGDNTIQKIIVTSQTGEEKIYTLTITKETKPVTPDEPNKDSPTVDAIINAIDVKFSDGYMTYFTEGTTATALINMINEKSATAAVTIKDKNANKKENVALATGDIISITSGEDTKNYTIVIKGDINGDGKINIIDLLMVQKHILKYTQFTEASKTACDANYDSNINIIDLLIVQKHILKYISLK